MLKLRKSEKLCSATAIDALFTAPGAKSALAFPLRAAWRTRGDCHRQNAATVQFFISVPKKKLRHAVDRVTMRRRIREAYRLNRHLLRPDLEPVDLALVYVYNGLLPYARVEHAMQKLLASL